MLVGNSMTVFLCPFRKHSDGSIESGHLPAIVKMDLINFLWGKQGHGNKAVTR